ncbi:hypothetical protein KKC83_02585 [Patescibacteria group bacterium]|nr:hypothetical protein [Patescibacteria group bacterium]MCG2698291.1 hypothetical protein [Candidatus Parcubacteria bacterium]MBU4015497.1 hypothetical protein [Patescibacteria group bacterium]MBU4026404.1 hypothetical protein [Patescibacteria group bacterium]MBU4073744.1 hypothetical protein [Patescibacteria group bacterium]
MGLADFFNKLFCKCKKEKGQQDAQGDVSSEGTDSGAEASSEEEKQQ